MKSKRLFAVIMSVVMLISLISVPVFAAAHHTTGEICEELGLIIGTGDEGVDTAYLATPATRQQAGLLVARLLGKEDDALAFAGTATFTDAAESEAFWQPILAYLKANPTLGFGGYPDGSFNPLGTITGPEFSKSLLTIMGYTQGVNYEWADVMDFAAEQGLTVLAGKGPLTMQDVADAIVQALGLNTSTGLTLISDLVENGVVDRATAEALGYVIGTSALAITTAYASAVNKVTVALNQPAPEDAVVTLKRGTLGFNTTVTYSADRTVITLTGFYNYPAGIYTVTVNDASYEFTIQAQEAVDLIVGATTVFKAAGQDLQVNLLNQYGQKMDLAPITYSVFNKTNATRVVTPTLEAQTIKVDASAANVGDEIFVFVYQSTYQLSVQAIVTVQAVPVLTGITLGDIVIKDGKADIYQGTTGHILKVTAVDQYGNPYKLTTADLYPSGTVHLTSSSAAVDTLSINTDGNITLNAPAPGSAVIMVAIPTKAIVLTKSVTVLASPVLTSLTVAPPATTPIYAKEAATLQVTALDQYGNAIEYPGSHTITFTSSNSAIVDGTNFSVATNKITMTAQSAGTATVFYYLNGAYKGSFTFTALAEAVPTLITGLKNVPTAYQTGTALTLANGDVTVVDQYGRADTLTGDWKIDVTAPGADNFTLTGALGSWTITTTATAGTDTFNVFLHNGTTRIASSVYSFTLANVSPAQIVGFEFKTLPTMYSGATRVYGQASDAYVELLEIMGKTSDGRIVELLINMSSLRPDIIDLFTFSTANLGFFGPGGMSIEAINSVDQVVTIKAWRDGAEVAMTTVQLAKADPVVTTMSVPNATVAYSSLPGGYPAGHPWYNLFVAKDQYGRTLSVADLKTAGKVLFTHSTVVVSTSRTDLIVTMIKWDGTLSITVTITDVPTMS
ncbi:MAG: hypothetical protein R6W96_01605 [Clostridia bacterium]